MARRPVAVVADVRGPASTWQRPEVEDDWVGTISSCLHCDLPTLTNFRQYHVYDYPHGYGRVFLNFAGQNLSGLAVIGYTKRKQVAVYLATN